MIIDKKCTTDFTDTTDYFPQFKPVSSTIWGFDLRNLAAPMKKRNVSTNVCDHWSYSGSPRSYFSFYCLHL